MVANAVAPDKGSIIDEIIPADCSFNTQGALVELRAKTS